MIPWQWMKMIPREVCGEPPCITGKYLQFMAILITLDNTDKYIQIQIFADIKETYSSLKTLSYKVHFQFILIRV